MNTRTIRAAQKHLEEWLADLNDQRAEIIRWNASIDEQIAAIQESIQDLGYRITEVENPIQQTETKQ